MIRAIIIFLLIYLLYKVVKKLFLNPGPANHTFKSDMPFNKNQPSLTDEMVQDPECQVYIPKRDAFTFAHTGTTYYFCSRECMQQFKDKQGR